MVNQGSAAFLCDTFFRSSLVVFMSLIRGQLGHLPSKSNALTIIYVDAAHINIHNAL